MTVTTSSKSGKVPFAGFGSPDPTGNGWETDSLAAVLCDFTMIQCGLETGLDKAVVSPV